MTVQENLKEYLPDGVLSQSQYCAGSDREGVSTAPGDSGGPSVIREYVGGVVRYTLVGVVSGSWSSSDNIYVFIGHNEVEVTKFIYLLSTS